MVSINTSPVLRGGDYIMEFEATATTNLTDYVFPSTQETIFIHNRGVHSLTIIASDQLHRISPNQSLRITENTDRVQIKSDFGTQPFIIGGHTGSVSSGTSGPLPSNVVLFEDWIGGETVTVGETITPPSTETPPNPTDTTAPVLTMTAAATFADTQTVNMSVNETADIWYTVDGSDPVASGTRVKYSAPVTLTATTTVKAYAVDTAGNASGVQLVIFTKEVPAYVTDGLIRYKDNPTVGTFENSQELFSGTGSWTFESTVTLGTPNGTRNIVLRAIDSATSGGITGNSPSIQVTFENKMAINLWGRNTSNNASTWVSINAAAETLVPSTQSHIAIVRDSTSLKLFINNTLVKTVTVASTVDLHANALAMNFLQSGQGIVSKNYTYYNRALTPDELTQNYNALK